MLRSGHLGKELRRLELSRGAGEREKEREGGRAGGREGGREGGRDQEPCRPRDLWELVGSSHPRSPYQLKIHESAGYADPNFEQFRTTCTVYINMLNNVPAYLVRPCLFKVDLQ